jgi:hypothetical protein
MTQTLRKLKTPRLQEQETPQALPAAEPRAPQVSAQDAERLIQESAYYKAEARGFAPGGELQDWLEAESEVRGNPQRPS